MVLERDLVYLVGGEGLKASFQPSSSNFALAHSQVKQARVLGQMQGQQLQKQT